MIGTRCGSRTRLYCVKNSGPTDRRTGLALLTRIELVLADRQSAVQTTTLQEHGGRCRYRSHAGLSRVLGSFQDCLPGHGRHLPFKARGRIRTNYFHVTKVALVLTSHTGMESTARLERAYSSFADRRVDRFTTSTCCARGRIRTDRIRIKSPVQFLVCFARVLVRERGVEPRHNGAKNRRRPGWLLPIDGLPGESRTRAHAPRKRTLFR
jgi:hypothetical protein